MASGRARLMTLVVGGTDPARPRPRWQRMGWIDLVVVADVIIAIATYAGTAAWLRDQNSRHNGHYADLTLMLIAIAVSAPMALRNRYPLMAWECSALSIGVVALVIPSRSMYSVPFIPGSLLVYVLCLYALAVRCRRELTIAAAVVTVIGASIIDRATFVISIPAMIPLLLGYTVRLRRTSRAEIAEVERRHEGERAVLEERQRIAREMHDVIAHHMSLIAIQAEAAPLTVPDVPPKIKNDLVEIRSTALEALTELRRILGVLRTEDGSGTAPQPGLDRLEDLIASARTAGLTVEMSCTGRPQPLGPGTGLSAYRIVQESLSNAMRHARGGSVRIEVAYEPDALRLLIVNTDGESAVPVGSGSGRGLVGMRERAAMLGGGLEAGPLPDGGFAVRAVLPLDER